MNNKLGMWFRKIGIRILYKTAFMWPDKTYLKLLFYLKMGKRLNLDNPQTFSEKLQWLKLNNKNPDYTRMVDKVAAKDYVAEKIGKEYLIPTLGVWDNVDDIDFNSLPQQFVLKCSHDSGGVVICKDKSKLDVKKVKKQLNKSLNTDYYMRYREWPYKNVPRRILAEKFMANGDVNDDLKDYKFMCFDGKAHCSFVCSDRNNGKGLKITFFDREWNRLPFERHYPSDTEDIKMPTSYKEMMRLAEVLSEKIPFVRTDFYEIEGHLYFGELTFFPGTGMEEFTPEQWDKTLGELIVLPPRQVNYY